MSFSFSRIKMAKQKQAGQYRQQKQIPILAAFVIKVHVKMVENNSSYSLFYLYFY
jgi:hypothetical protein